MSAPCSHVPHFRCDQCAATFCKTACGWNQHQLFCIEAKTKRKKEEEDEEEYDDFIVDDEEEPISFDRHTLLYFYEPKVNVAHQFLSPNTYAQVMQFISGNQARFERSFTSGADEDQFRTSQYVPLDGDIAETVKQEALTKLGLNNDVMLRVERLQIIRYLPGQEFQMHHDAGTIVGDDGDDEVIIDYDTSTSRYIKYVRLYTIFLYLVAPDSGGHTVFPRLGISVSPEPNTAAYWSNLAPDGSIEPRVIHAGEPVTSGVKYGMNIWILKPVL